MNNDDCLNAAASIAGAWGCEITPWVDGRGATIEGNNKKMRGQLRMCGFKVGEGFLMAWTAVYFYPEDAEL